MNYLNSENFYMMNNKEKSLVAYYMRLLYERGLTTCSGGNVSLKMDNKIFITSSQTDKSKIKENEIAVITLEGENLTPELKPSMEYLIHLKIFRKRKDVNAIIHAHPTTATAFSASDAEIKTNLTGETRALLGTPLRVPYHLMGTEKLATSVANASRKTNVIIMENHGIITFADNIQLAFERLELIEEAAKITLITNLLGNKKEIPVNEIKKIDNLILNNK